VAFYADRIGDSCIYRSEGTTLTEIAKTGVGAIRLLGFRPSINDAGTVAFWAGYAPTGAAIRVGNGVTMTELVRTSDTRPDISDSPVINNNGRTVYGIKDASGNWAIRSSMAGGSTIEYAKDGSGGFSGLSPTMPSINSNDQVVFRGYYSPPPRNGIHVSTSGSSLVAITEGMGLINDFGNAPDINSSGHVVFEGGIDGTPGSFGLYVGGAGISPVLVAGSDVYVSASYSTAEINNHGEVAFSAKLASSGALGIFTGNDPIADRVVMAGDLLDGSSIESIVMGRNGLNDQGQIAFWAQLADGRQGIFVAAPVPEPGTIAMCVLGGLTAMALVAPRWGRDRTGRGSKKRNRA
jgi:hypothetical protein